MLTVQENETLTRVGKGTPMGELMRRYWHPIAATGQLQTRPTLEVRLLGEDLVLFRDLQGRYGLIDRYCAHRRVDLSYGIPEEQGLRCMYHGWMYDTTGQCVEQPFEETVHPPVSRPSQSGSSEGVVKQFKEKVKLAGYPVQELGGLLFAYLGPQPAPLLPQWEQLVWDNVVRDIGITHLPCNWLQCQENSLDPVHAEWLHNYYGNYLRTGKGANVGQSRTVRLGFDPFQYGVIKRRLREDSSEEDDDWKEGHPAIFPNMLLVGNQVQCLLQFRVPMDDEHTLHISYYVYSPAPGAKAPRQELPAYRHTPLYEEDGTFVMSNTFNQDFMAWIKQGPIADRNREVLGMSDVGIISYRKMLKEQMAIVADGGDPINVFRPDGRPSGQDPTKAGSIRLPLEKVKRGITAVGGYMPTEAGKSDAQPLIDEVLQTWVAAGRERAAASVI